MPTIKRVSNHTCCKVQKKLTPFRKPRNRGGSPSGVSEPPMFATRKMKKITVCTLYLRCAFARISGRISSMAAPVVPIQLARIVPISRMAVFTAGLPARLPVTLMPPEIVNRANSRMINGTYSSRMVCMVS